MSTHKHRALSATSDETAGLRVPPHSIEAEQSVLGGLLLDNRAWDRAADLVTEADFYRHEHKLIYAAIGSLVQANKPADVITVFERLQNIGKADDVGGLAYLQALAQSVPSASNMRRYAEIVRERSILRTVITVADDMATAAFDPQGRSVVDITHTAAGLIGELDRRQIRKGPRLIGDVLATALDRYIDLSEGRRQPGLATGIAPLDRLLVGGLKPAKLYGIAARPSVGKSSAARTILLHLARAKVVTLLLSQEMHDQEVADAFVAEAGRVDGAVLQTGQFGPDDSGRIAEAIDALRALPLHIDDEGGLTLAQVRAKARSVPGLQVLCVDYLQLMTSTIKGKSTNDEIAEISKGLKALSKELGTPIIVLSQLNRELEKRGDKEPQLSDLRDSGAIEQDLDVAILLWTAVEDEESRLVGWKVAKNRGGRKGSFGMRWNPAINEWRESLEPLRPAPATTAEQPKGGRRRGADL